MFTFATFLLMVPCAMQQEPPSRNRRSQEAQSKARPDLPWKGGDNAEKSRKGFRDGARRDVDQPRRRGIEGRKGSGKGHVRDPKKGLHGKQGKRVCESCGKGGPAGKDRAKADGRGESQGKDRAQALRKKLGTAVQSGKMTREQAGEKMRAFKLEQGGEGQRPAKGSEKEMMGFRRRLGAAVQSGKMTREEAGEKMRAFMEKRGQSREGEQGQRGAKTKAAAKKKPAANKKGRTRDF